MQRLTAATLTYQELHMRGVKCIVPTILKTQASAWSNATRKAAESIGVELEEVPGETILGKEEQQEPIDLCTMFVEKVSPSVAGKASNLVFQRRALIVALLSADPLPQPEKAEWFASLGETPLAGSTKTSEGIVLPGSGSIDVPRLGDMLFCYQTGAAFARILWILQRAADEHERRSMGDLPI